MQAVRPEDSERRRRRDAELRSSDERIAEHLEALRATRSL